MTASERSTARHFGVFFLLAFVSYGTGSALTEPLLAPSASLEEVVASASSMTFGVLCMAVVHTVFNVGVAAAILPALLPGHRTFAYGYFGIAVAASATLVVGGIAILVLIAAAKAYVGGAPEVAPALELLVGTCRGVQFHAYQIGMALWGAGGLLLCWLLGSSRLAPRPLVAWGFVGYAVFIAGTVLELYGHRVGVALSLPGGSFEIALSLRFIVSGFGPGRGAATAT